MPEPTPRLYCPVCLGTKMERAAVGAAGAPQIDHCRRCGGIWLEHGEVQQLRGQREAELWRYVTPRVTEFRMRCHSCHAALSRDAQSCAACGWTNVLDCPACLQPMRTESYGGLRIDVCHGCKGVWFDNHELQAIWGAHFDRALRTRDLPRRTGTSSAVPERSQYGPADALLDTIFFAPDLVYLGVHGVGQTVAASAEAAARLPDAVSASPEVAALVVEAVGEAAGSVFEVVVGVIGGIFDGL
jgi:Zn-finger nucleic acid-binding protein